MRAQRKKISNQLVDPMYKSAINPVRRNNGEPAEPQLVPFRCQDTQAHIGDDTIHISQLDLPRDSTAMPMELILRANDSSCSSKCDLIISNLCNLINIILCLYIELVPYSSHICMIPKDIFLPNSCGKSSLPDLRCVPF